MQGRTFKKCLPAGHSGTHTSHKSWRRSLSTQHIVLQASDWEFRLYLWSEALQFPIETTATSLRPDIILYSCTQKIIVMLKLTVPLEDRSHLLHERKNAEIRIPCPHMWRKWLYNTFLCLRNRLSWFLPPTVSWLALRPGSTKVFGSQSQDRTRTRGTNVNMFLPPLP